MEKLRDSSIYQLWHKLRHREIIFLLFATLIYAIGISSFLVYVRHEMFLVFPREGQVWNYNDLFAPFDFITYKSPEESGREIDSLSQRHYIAIIQDSASIYQAQRALDSLQTKLPPEILEELHLVKDFAYRFGYTNFPISMLKGIALLKKPSGEEVFLSLSALVDTHQLARWIEQNPQISHKQEVLLWSRRLFIPNSFYDPPGAEERFYQTRQQLLSSQGVIREGELIIRRGERISPSTYQKLLSLRSYYLSSYPLAKNITAFLGITLLIASINYIALYYLYASNKISLHNSRPVLLLFTIYAFMTILVMLFTLKTAHIAQELEIPLRHLVPFALGPIILAIFFDDRVGFVAAVTLGAQVSLIMEEPVEYFFVHGFSSMLAVFQLRVMQKRSDLYYALAVLVINYILTYVGYHAFIQESFRTIPWKGIPILLTNAILCLTAYPLIYLIEKAFNLSSDITFLELLNMNHPLLKELKMRAPGTFQHSLAVANLAEAAAHAIGAHPLKAQVMALFHDVGKLHRPQYFIENLAAIPQGHTPNPHHDLSPRESATIIKDHVSYGIKLAQKYRLPIEIIQGIATHHGTTCIKYFWEKERRQNPDEAEKVRADFYYAGPLPSTREEVILMLSDSLEASTRAISQPTPELLRKHVKKIIQERIEEGQLDAAPLSFSQLKILEEVFYNQLRSLHHARIQYPSQEKEPERFLR
ncbi:MAG: HDIG domain-containing protein [Bacteroidia bacterium]|nr:HDIG domain-containing protein [Bacteroidia bacterium]MDW8235780.1 HDIG domain-containing protein [Bacteroidia bacterium]